MPDLSPSEEWLLQGFWKLSTARYVGLALGPLPITAIWEFCDREELDTETSELVEVVFSILDSKFLRYVSKSKGSSEPSKK